MSTRPHWIVWLGMAVVLLAAAVLSFDGLLGLATTVRIPAEIAWLLPICVDAGAAVSCAVWLGGRSPADAARVAGRMTWALLATTVAGNAGHLGMVAEGITPPWWVAVLVGAIPPAVVGSVVHLVVLLTRQAPKEATEGYSLGDHEPEREVVLPPRQAVLEIRETNLEVVGDDLENVGDDLENDLESRARELVAGGAGRTKLMRELDLSEYEARQLLTKVRRTLEVVR